MERGYDRKDWYLLVRGGMSGNCWEFDDDGVQQGNEQETHCWLGDRKGI